MDELDCSMHPLLTRKLVELFQSPDANRGRAQLVFATARHDALESLFPRDQVWLVEKKQSGGRNCSRFTTSRAGHGTLRRLRNYLAGRYDAVPNFGPIFENLELK